MRAVTAVAALVLAGALAPMPAAAQVCAGSRSLRTAPLEAAVGGALHSYATSLHASLTGSPTRGGSPFAMVSAGRTHDAELYATAWEVRVHAGYDGALDPERLVFVCPSVSMARSDGPADFMLSGYSYGRREASLGLRFALIVTRIPRVTLVPVAGASVHRIRARRRSGTGHVATRTDTYGQADLTIGILMGERFTVRPGFTVPFGLTAADAFDWFAAPFGRENAEFSFGLSVAIAFGSRESSDS